MTPPKPAAKKIGLDRVQRLLKHSRHRAVKAAAPPAHQYACVGLVHQAATEASQRVRTQIRVVDRLWLRTASCARVDRRAESIEEHDAAVKPELALRRLELGERARAVFLPREVDGKRPVSPPVALKLGLQEGGVAGRLEMSTVRDAPAAEQHRPCDLAEREPHMRLLESEPREVRAIGHGHPEPGSSERSGAQEAGGRVLTRHGPRVPSAS